MTARLHRLTAHLSTALRENEIAQIVVDEGTAALRAKAGALWATDREANELTLIRATGYPSAAIASFHKLSLTGRSPATDAAIHAEPVWLSSRRDYEEHYPTSAERTRALAEGEYAVAALPITFEARVTAVLVLTFDGEMRFDADERQYLTFLALECGQGFERARLYEAETRARLTGEAAHARAGFLVKASELLGSSLDTKRRSATLPPLPSPRWRTGAPWSCSMKMVRQGK